MKEIIELRVRKNKKARLGEPTEYISLYELHKKSAYRVPYNRWAKDLLFRYRIKAEIKKGKMEGRGRSPILYYVPIETMGPIENRLLIRKNIEIHYRREQDLNESVLKYTHDDLACTLNFVILECNFYVVAKSLLFIKGMKDLILTVDKEDVIFLDSSLIGLEPNRKLRLLSESGLYSVIWRSNNFIIRDLKNWLIVEVLPDIRKKLKRG